MSFNLPEIGGGGGGGDADGRSSAAALVVGKKQAVKEDLVWWRWDISLLFVCLLCVLDLFVRVLNNTVIRFHGKIR